MRFKTQGRQDTCTQTAWQSVQADPIFVLPGRRSCRAATLDDIKNSCVASGAMLSLLWVLKMTCIHSRAPTQHLCSRPETGSGLQPRSCAESEGTASHPHTALRSFAKPIQRSRTLVRRPLGVVTLFTEQALAGRPLLTGSVLLRTPRSQ